LTRTVLISLSVAALLALAPGLAAQQPQNGVVGSPQAATVAASAAEALPTRVGRVSLADGKAEWRGDSASAWSPAAVNDPLWSGSALRTDAAARGAIEIDTASVRLAGDSELEIANLRNGLIDVALRQGRIGITLHHLGAGETVRIDTARGGVQLDQPGIYDIDAGNAASPTRIAVFQGSAHFVGVGADTTATAGQAAVLTGSNPISASIEKAASDAFVEWCRGRDWNDATLVSPYHVSTEMAGYEQLDLTGNWRQSGAYGWVWFPRGMTADWAPYRDGHWLWTAPWGWSWIDDMPWGFAPSHYGRWARIDDRWGWVPGALERHPAYVPAVVAFLGTAGIGLSVAGSSTPAVAWFPLAPGEVYWPRYSGDLAQIRALNRATVPDAAKLVPDAHGGPPADIVNGTFANRRFASAVARPIFVGGKPVTSALLQIPEQRLLEAPVLMGSPDIAPPAPKVAAAPPPKVHHAAVAARATAASAARPLRTAASHPGASAHLRTTHAVRTAASTSRREPLLRAAHFRAPGAGRRPLPHRLVALHVTHTAHPPVHRVPHRS
jgi:hypothetical protein